MVCPPSRQLTLALLLLGAWAGLISGATAQVLEQRLAQAWRWREIVPPPGMPLHERTAKGPGGSLYSALGNQIHAFDGTRWKRVGALHAPVRAMVQNGRGLIVLTVDEACVYVDEHGEQATNVPNPAKTILRAYPMLDGEVIVVATSAYYSLREGQARPLDLPFLAGTTGLARDAQGRLMVLAQGRAYRAQDGSWLELSMPPSPEYSAEYGPLLSHEGELWAIPGAGGFGRPLLRFDGEQFLPVSDNLNSDLTVAIPGQGFLSWHSDRGALLYRDGRWNEVPRIQGIEGQVPRTAFCDGERLFVRMVSGRLWAVDYASRRWSHDVPELASGRVQVHALAPSRRGGAWIASSVGLLRWEDGAFPEQYTEANGLPLKILTTVCEDREGGVWVGSGATFTGAMRLSGDRWERPENPTADFNVHSIELDDKGDLWFMLLSGRGDARALNGGLVRYDGEAWTRFTVADGLPDNRCYDVLSTRAGEFLVGTAAGVGRLRDDRWVHERILGEDAARMLFESSDGRLWIGGGIRTAGVRAFTGLRSSAPSRPEFEHLMVGGMSEDPQGRLWISARQGLFQLDQGGLLHEATQEYGVPARAFWPQASLGDGALLLGSLERGLLTYRPDDTAPPLVMGLNVTVDEDRRARASWIGSDPWATTPTPELRYRWRLSGGLWSDLATSTTALLGRLPHGSHELEVEGFDLAGNCSALPTRLEFTVPAPFWARPSVLLTAGLGALLIFSLAAFSLRQWFAARTREREESRRIADSERHYRTLVERVRVLIASFDQRGVLTYVSPGLARLLNAPPHEVTTELFLERLAPHTGEHALELRSILLEGRPGGWAGELPLEPSADGAGTSAAWLYAILSPSASLAPDTQTGWDFAAVDLTARKEGEQREAEFAEQLTRARRLEAIGRLSAGIGHDFNNLLTAISGNADIVAKRLDQPAFAPLHSHLEEIHLATAQAQNLTQRLLSFGREQDAPQRVLPFDETISAVLPVLRRLLDEGVELSFEPGGAGMIECGEGQIERVLINLVLNAQDALQAGGEVHVSTRRVTLDEQQARRLPPLEPGEYACLSVRDTGVGMDAATLERALEPFFTTKGEGRGTGLGLATVHGIATRGRGQVEVQSTPGRGTTIDVYMPLVDETTRARPGRASAFPTVGSGAAATANKKTLLFCEDDPGVRAFVSKCLDGHGYELLVASDPEEALATSARHEGEIDLLLTDVIMPGLNGFELAQRLRGQRAGLRVLYVSGYSADLLSEEGFRRGQYNLLQKPFRPETLLERVREVLAEVPQPPT